MAHDPMMQDSFSSAKTGHSLRCLDDVPPLYMLPMDPLAEEVLIPGFVTARQVDCMVGFFSSEVLVSLAPGLASYISTAEDSFRLVVSPLLRAEDQAAIEEGLQTPDEVADKILGELTVTEDLLQRHTLKCLSWLLRCRCIEIKIALMKDALFHPKAWLFGNDDDIVAAHGSSNVTYAGIRKNIEQIAISRSWQDPNQRYITDRLRNEFDRLWDNNYDNCIVIPIPEAVQKQLLRDYCPDYPPSEDELRALYAKASGVSEHIETYGANQLPERPFSIPAWLRYEDGPFEHICSTARYVSQPPQVTVNASFFVTQPDIIFALQIAFSCSSRPTVAFHRGSSPASPGQVDFIASSLALRSISA